MASRELVLSRGEEGVLRRLDEEAAAIARLERLLAGARRRRLALCLKAVAAGIPLRTIEKHAGISNARISQITSS